jgi:hypothetical protein
MPLMPTESEAQAERRRMLLDPVARMCERAGFPVAPGRFEGPGGTSVAALVCAPHDGSWDAMLTVVRAQTILVEHQALNGRWRRDPRTGYDLTSDGDLVYELQIHEDDDGGSGHGPRPLVVFQLLDEAKAAADALIQWWRRSARFHAPPPAPDRRAEQRRAARVAEHRRTASASPRVHLHDAPSSAAAYVAAVDPAALALHFPRERSGNFLRSAAVALAPLDGAPPHMRGRWLTVRAKADELYVGVEDLIGGNQAHRWNLTPWMWDRRHVDASPRGRWQLDNAAQARPYLDALAAGRVTEALNLAGVAVDDQLAKLLRGEPNRIYRAELTEKWVANLYASLTESAPWRFAKAHAAWLAERGGRPKPATMFGLKGLGQSRKPKVVLDRTPSGPILRLEFSGGNLILPLALWTVPADLS